MRRQIARLDGALDRKRPRREPMRTSRAVGPMLSILMRILAVCGSLQAGSSNHAPLELARSTAPDDVEIVLRLRRGTAA